MFSFYSEYLGEACLTRLNLFIMDFYPMCYVAPRFMGCLDVRFFAVARDALKLIVLAPCRFDSFLYDAGESSYA